MPPPRKPPRRSNAAASRKSPPAARGRRKLGLSREHIVSTALELVDRNGLAALTARRLAATLGCEAMSLYHYFGAMEELLDAIADRLLLSVPPPARGADPHLSATLRSIAVSYLEVARRHPRAFPLLAARRLRSQASSQLLGEVVERLRVHGVDTEAALRTLRILVAYLNGAGLALAAWELDSREEQGVASAAASGRQPKRSRPDRAPVVADLEAGIDLLIGALTAAR